MDHLQSVNYFSLQVTHRSIKLCQCLSAMTACTSVLVVMKQVPRLMALPSILVEILIKTRVHVLYDLCDLDKCMYIVGQGHLSLSLPNHLFMKRRSSLVNLSSIVVKIII